MIIECRFQHFSSRTKDGRTYSSLDCYDDVAGCALQMSVDDSNHISELLKTMHFADPITCSVRLYEASKGQYRFICYDVDKN